MRWGSYSGSFFFEKFPHFLESRSALSADDMSTSRFPPGRVFTQADKPRLENFWCRHNIVSILQVQGEIRGPLTLVIDAPNKLDIAVSW